MPGFSLGIGGLVLSTAQRSVYFPVTKTCSSNVYAKFCVYHSVAMSQRCIYF